jgi:lysophospholipase
MAPPRTVLVLYTGGTIGMVDGPRGYRPESGYLHSRLLAMPQFHDSRHRTLTLPPLQDGRAVTYDVLEYEHLVDSACMRRTDWVRLARDIERYFDQYDAFVVLHGTDTMAYSASALSFMLVNLSKTVILTGSQIPLSHHRNDGVDNLLGALTLAGHYDLPEVGLYFRNTLLRGNRASKVDAASFAAFTSGNLRPLARVGIGIDIDWSLIRKPGNGEFKVKPITCDDIAAVRLFPGMTSSTLDRLLQPPLKGVVLETYGSGNAPASDPAFLSVLDRASKRGLVVANVTQCLRGRVNDAYEMGRALSDVGVVGGGDMTAEAALTKLGYLLSQDLPTDEVRRFFQVDLRGEITPRSQETRFSFRERDFGESPLIGPEL